jgi:hypothetical protein
LNPWWIFIDRKGNLIKTTYVVIKGGRYNDNTHLWRSIWTIKELYNHSTQESVRRWLRQGVIKGIAPSSRKEGWHIPKEALDDFIKIRLPNAYTTNIAKELDSDNVSFNEKEVEERIRAVMWGELANKNMWEGYMELKYSWMFQHRRYCKELEAEVWQRCNCKQPSIQETSYFLFAWSVWLWGKTASYSIRILKI